MKNTTGQNILNAFKGKNKRIKAEQMHLGHVVGNLNIH